MAKQKRPADVQELPTPDIVTDRVMVTLAVDGHVHNGQPLSKGDTIEVSAGQKAWLGKHHLIEDESF